MVWNRSEGGILRYGFNWHRRYRLADWVPLRVAVRNQGLVWVLGSFQVILVLPLFFTKFEKYSDWCFGDWSQGFRMLHVCIWLLPRVRIQFAFRPVGEQDFLNTREQMEVRS